MTSQIVGVEFKEIVSFSDNRGFFSELIRDSDIFANEGVKQISHSLVFQNVTKAWHAHVRQSQWNYVVNGVISVALYDLRKESDTYKNMMTFLCGDHQKKVIYKFPPGVAHGYKCISGPMNIIYFTSGEYDPEDEIRIPHDDINIGFDWLKNDIK